MAEGLFDGRYRYDYIYPRGRSGETLRAYDTQNDNRPVVIKRPAPNDAPPVRGGQESSILTERDALKTLSGHPVLTELVGEGHFMAGGQTHRYIVMERGMGDIIADMVLNLAKERQRLHLLEMLVITDNLLDLLQTAHSRDIVYNDVDAKHLFWNRDAYRLKVIDWGNAVFLEGEIADPRGVSKQSDIYQTGELLYFMLTGGRRADVPRDADVAFLVDFGEDAERIPSELARVVSNALHPNPKLRYATIGDLRRELAAVRKPFENERNGILATVNERLRRDRSKDELIDLIRVLDPALLMDRGYPPAKEARAEIENRLKDLQTSADLDAARIYLETGSWRGAADILRDLKGHARGDMLQLVRLLFDWAVLLLEDNNSAQSATIPQAVGLVFDGQHESAAHLLMTATPNNPALHRIHMRLAERITSHMTDVVLLRPNLFRLAEALAQLDGTDGVRLTEQRELLDEIHHMLDAPQDTDGVSMMILRDTYRGIVDRLSALTTLMEAVNMGWGERRLPLSSLERARSAAMMLADNMHVIGKQAAAAPRDALGALDNSRAIDPTHPAWEHIQNMLNGLYGLLESYQTYVPMADAADLAGWLHRSQQQLAPYNERLFDEMLVGMMNGLKIAAEQWDTYDIQCLRGSKVGVLKLLAASSEAVGTVSPTLAGWFNQLRSVINGAAYAERHALSGGLGRTLADGWGAFDSGRLTDAERLAAQAAQIAKTDEQKFIVTRFRTLTETLRGWVERGGWLSIERTTQALKTVTGLYTEQETRIADRFNGQMPSQETYLKAMNKGLVDLYAALNSAAPRVLFVDFVLQGVIDAHEAMFDDSAFWEQAARNTLPKHADQHPAITTLQELVARRQDLLAVAEAFNSMTDASALESIEDTRKQYEQHPRTKLISEAVHSLREVESALPDWANAEFRTAGMKLENAVKAATETERAAQIDLGAYKAWLSKMQAVSAELHTVKRDLIEQVERRTEAPTDDLERFHRTLLDRTADTIGAEYTATLQLWYDTYLSFAEVMDDDTRRRSAKLAAFNDLFRAMFIDRQPAYPLYRHWFDLTDRSPEFPAPPTSDPQPRMDEDDEPLDAPIADEGIDFSASRYVEGDDDTPAESSRRRPRFSWVMWVLVGVAILAVGGVIASQFVGGDDESAPFAVTISPTPTTNATGTAAAIVRNTAEAVRTENAVANLPTTTPEPTDALDALATQNNDIKTQLTEAFAALNATQTTTTDTEPTTISATDTPQPTEPPTVTPTATETPLPTATYTPSVTPLPSATPTPAVPAGGFIGEVDILGLMSRLPQENPNAIFWDTERLSVDGETWRMGIGSDTEQVAYTLITPPDWVAAYMGDAAANRLAVFEVTLSLATFNPALLSGEDGVFFGAMLVPADAADNAFALGSGLQVDVVQPGVVNIGTRADGDVDVVSQRALSAVIVRVRLERRPDGSVQTFFNGEPLGIAAIPPGGGDPNTPLLPAIFVTDGGVILNITDWSVTLR